MFMKQLAEITGLPRPTSVSLNKDGGLIFRWSDETGTSRKPTRLPRLQAFMNLATAADETIRAFAERHGPLFGRGAQEESIEDWRYFARLSGCLLREGQLFAGRRVGILPAEDFDAILEWIRQRSGLLPRSRNYYHRRLYLIASMNKLLEKGGCEVSTWWTADSIQVLPYSHRLLGVIALKLCDEIKGRGQLVKCYECPTWFRPKRILPGKRQFCRKCGRRAAMKHLMRERRRRLG
jgi:hypothetical protein